MNIRYHRFFKWPRVVLKYLLSFCYPVVTRIWPLPKVLSIEDTIKKIIENRYSIARFGDGEFLYILDKIDLPFQRYDSSLAKSLANILHNNQYNLMVGLPSGYHGMENLNKEGRVFWKAQISWIYPRLSSLLLENRIYGNASMTRLYYEIENKNQSALYFELAKHLWKERDVIIIEGEFTRFGVGNDLLLQASSIQRILGPAQNAYYVLPVIIKFLNDHSRSKLILVALGPAAKVLVAELTTLGFQAIDIGNLDIEYEWFLKGVTKKVKVPGKYTSEAKGGRLVEDIYDTKYEGEIIARFYE